MKKIVLLLVCIAMRNGILHAQKLPSTFLWKISGNGLQKPSYLYGTMHLTDDRIFNLGDSLYSAIENCDGFAIEINPDDFTPFIIDETKKNLLESQRLKEMMSEKDFKKYGKVLAKKLKKNENDITTADVLHEKNKWIEESYRTGKMQTFLDVYLFDVARRQGKWMGGVEDIQDQENLINSLVDESDIEELANSDDGNRDKHNDVSGIERMIKVYTNNDLNAIDAFSNLEDSTYHDALLTKRNKKMAMRMDSLSHERSMVFAVGVAHLPGDDGVIELLKQKGFTVTPVFSSKKIKPVDYKLPKISLPWYDVKDDAGFYSAAMPGKPGNMELYGLLNMKLYFDVFNSTVYMTTAMHTPYSSKMADSVFGVVSDYYFDINDYTKGKPVSINNVPGREFVSDVKKYSRGYLLYKDGMMYMAIAMSMKKDTANAASINKFLHSFVIHSENIEDDTKYFTYEDKQKAYSIDLPAKPRSAMDLSSLKKDTSINQEINVVTDPKTGAYLFFGVNQATKGFFIENDSALLVRIKESQKNKFSEISIDTTYIVDDHRVMDYGGTLSQAPLMMKAHYEFRGNRWYALLAMYDPKKENPTVDRFFSSFKMLDYPAYEWNQYSSTDKIFSTWAPAEFDFVHSVDSSDGTISDKYECFDTSRANDYMITVESFSKYYWQNDEAAVMKKLIKTAVQYNDSLLWKKDIMNGDAKGIEIAIQKEGSNNIRRKRMLLNDNKLYTLFTVQQASEIDNDNNKKFFEDFRFTTTNGSKELFTSKAKLLLNDLSDNDSAVRAGAKSYLNTVPFSKEELPLLHEALLKKYRSEQYEYETTNEAIQRIIVDLNDTSSYVFAKNNYFTADDEMKNLLLGIMVSFQTQEHFSDIKTLILKQPPVKEPDYSFIDKFTDSVQLAASVFPEILPLLKDTVMAPAITRIAMRLLDSNLINVFIFQPYQKDILNLAQKNYQKVKKDPDAYDYANYSIINLLGAMNNASCNAVLQNWSLLKSPYLQIAAISELLKNKQTLNPAALQSIASDKSTRTELYDTLHAYKKEALYPKAYLSQKSFAESYVYLAASDDDEPSDLTYLTQKIINFKGKQSRFYFYKVTYGEDEDAGYSLACAGPFNVNVTTVSTEDATGSLYYEEDFDPANLPAQMDALIKQMENWYEWKK